MNDTTREMLDRLNLSVTYEKARQDYCDYMLEMWQIKDKTTEAELAGNAYRFRYDGTPYEVHYNDVMHIVDFDVQFDVFKKWQNYRAVLGDADLCFYLAFILN